MLSQSSVVNIEKLASNIFVAPQSIVNLKLPLLLKNLSEILDDWNFCEMFLQILLFIGFNLILGVD